MNDLLLDFIDPRELDTIICEKFLPKESRPCYISLFSVTHQGSRTEPEEDMTFEWTGDCLNGREIYFEDSKATWKLISKVSEKTCQIDYSPPYESVTVFACEQVGGDNVGRKAIMKVRTEYVRCWERHFEFVDLHRILGYQGLSFQTLTLLNVGYHQRMSVISPFRKWTASTD